MWRGAVEWPAYDGGDVMVIAGGVRTELVLYPIGPGSTPGTRVTNWVVLAADGDPTRPPPRREDWARAGRPAELLPHLAGLRVPYLDVQALVRGTPMVFEFPMCDRDPLVQWGCGRVSLLGDAAHPMYPMGSNGAAQAILDARCLARRLAELPTEEALRSYEGLRRPQTTQVVLSNRRGGPEAILALVHGRAPDGFERIEDVIGQDELDEIAAGYQLITSAHGRDGHARDR